MTTKVYWFSNCKMTGVKIVNSTTTIILNLHYCISYSISSTNVITLTMTNGETHTLDFGNSTTNADLYSKLITFLEI